MAEIRDDALLLRAIPYSDSSLILHLLTENHGRISLMARGARRAKSPFRASILPLHLLSLRWREPRTGSMGTLLETRRLNSLLPENKVLAGQQLVANASKLFPDGCSHGYHELYEALNILSQRPEASGLCAATWKMLETSGWTGDLQHCWGCAEHIELDIVMYWRQGHLICRTCAANQGYLLSSGFRKSISGHMHQPSIKLNQEYIALWDTIIKDIYKTHLSNSA